MSDSTSSSAEIVSTLVQGDAFERRPASWFAIKGGHFFKVPRVSDSLAADVRSPESLKEARSEFKCLALLAQASAHVLPHSELVQEYACLVAPQLPGPELLKEMRQAKSFSRASGLVEEGCRVLARIHYGSTSFVGDLVRYDYENDPSLPASSAELKAIARANLTVVCGGFEIRNLMRDASGELRFFDPHSVSAGIAEHDLMRYLVSLLMLRWGRRPTLGLWSNFSLENCISVYEMESKQAIDRSRASYAFRLCTSMRRSLAMRHVRNAPIWIRSLMHAYVIFFFGQMERWGDRHGL